MEESEESPPKLDCIIPVGKLNSYDIAAKEANRHRHYALNQTNEDGKATVRECLICQPEVANEQ